jgi:AcrR family transcriptional regulator
MASTKPGFDVREQILLAAENLIARRGTDNTSLLDIANKTKLSRGTLYYYFPTKQSLLLAVTDRHMDAVTTQFFKLINDQSITKPEDILQALFSLVLFDRRLGGIHAHLLQEAAHGNRMVRRRIALRYRAWNHLIVNEFARLGIVTKRKQKAAFILAVIDGLVVRQLLFGANARKGPYPAFIAEALVDKKKKRAAKPKKRPESLSV